MNPTDLESNLRPPSKITALWTVVALASFHLAYTLPGWGSLILIYPAAMILIVTSLRSSRVAFYGGLMLGLLLYGPQLHFFWNIFGPTAIVLWLVLALWLSFFFLVGTVTLNRFGRPMGLLFLPFLWTGLEYFRSELYYLRFSWLNGGYALSQSSMLPQSIERSITGLLASPRAR